MTADVILIDDEQHLRTACRQALELDGLTVESFGTAAGALDAVGRLWPGVVVSDVKMADRSGLELMADALARDPELPVILITGHGDIAMAVQAMRDGAYDFIEKPFANERLVEAVRRALEKRRLVLENRALRETLSAGSALERRLIGQTSAMRQLREQIASFAETDADVLVLGETGTGKELVARSLHELSPRREVRFVPINCGALPETIIESELFGHEAGAFTGAEKRRIGRIEHAHKGTLFLDEVESMPMPLQVKLLRVLEEQRVERLGSNQVQEVDVRIIAATKADLKKLSDEGEFRSDLYYRLNVVKVDIPPLRERKEDVPMLFHHFVLIAAARYDRESIPLDAGQAARLMQHSWPGNVRELRNLAERYVLLGPAALDENEPSDAGNVAGRQTLSEMMDGFERSAIVSALNASHGSIKDTMVQLGIARKTLYDKMRKHGLDKAQFKD